MFKEIQIFIVLSLNLQNIVGSIGYSKQLTGVASETDKHRNRFWSRSLGKTRRLFSSARFMSRKERRKKRERERKKNGKIFKEQRSSFV